MDFEEIICAIQRMHGNVVQGRDVYLSPCNVEMLLAYLTNRDPIEAIHLMPYLIDREVACELPSYMFDLEVSDVTFSYFVSHPPMCDLPREIVDRIRPRAVVHRQDRGFYVRALKEYLANMASMRFDRERCRPELASAELFFRVG